MCTFRNVRAFRILGSAGTALWVGGQFFGIVALPAAAAVLPRRQDRSRVIEAGWKAWTPMSFAALTAAAVGALIDLRTAADPAERKVASLRLAASLTGIASTTAATVLGLATKRQPDGRDGYPVVRNESGLPVTYLRRRPSLRRSMIPVNALHAVSALGMVLAAP